MSTAGFRTFVVVKVRQVEEEPDETARSCLDGAPTNTRYRLLIEKSYIPVETNGHKCSD